MKCKVGDIMDLLPGAGMAFRHSKIKSGEPIDLA
jgi:hypothetical protein